MNSREIILAAINHKETDKIPLDMGATPSSGISIVAYQNLMKYLGLDLKTFGYDVIQQLAQPDMEILDMFGVDVVDLGRFFNDYDAYWHELELTPGYKTLYPKWFNPRKNENSTWLASNPNGKDVGQMPNGATFFDQTQFPYVDGFPSDYKKLPEAMSLAVWGGLGITPWDSSPGPDFWKNLREKSIEARQKTDKAIILGIGCNLFEWGCFLRRMDNFLMDPFMNPVDTHKLLDALMEIHMDNLVKTCEAVGDVVDIIKFGDDFGMNSGPFMEAATYQEFFKPRHKMLCDYVKENTNMVTFLHSCGSVENLIPDFVDAGFDVLNPVQINAFNMDPAHLKKEFGKDITFWGGGVNTQEVLNKASVQEVKEHTRRNIEIFSEGGGFVFNTVHNIMPDVPPENIVAMMETVREFTK